MKEIEKTPQKSEGGLDFIFDGPEEQVKENSNTQSMDYEMQALMDARRKRRKQKL